MILHWPQIILLALQLFGLGVIAARHGKAQKPHNFWTSLIAVLVVWSLLYFGGFFTACLAN